MLRLLALSKTRLTLQLFILLGVFSPFTYVLRSEARRSDSAAVISETVDELDTAKKPHVSEDFEKTSFWDDLALNDENEDDEEDDEARKRFDELLKEIFQRDYGTQTYDSKAKSYEPSSSVWDNALQTLQSAMSGFLGLHPKKRISPDHPHFKETWDGPALPPSPSDRIDLSPDSLSESDKTRSNFDVTTPTVDVLEEQLRLAKKIIGRPEAPTAHGDERTNKRDRLDKLSAWRDSFPTEVMMFAKPEEFDVGYSVDVTQLDKNIKRIRRELLKQKDDIGWKEKDSKLLMKTTLAMLKVADWEDRFPLKKELGGLKQHYPSKFQIYTYIPKVRFEQSEKSTGVKIKEESPARSPFLGGRSGQESP